MNAARITRQYYGYNGLFNSTRALYVSTYSLVLHQWLSLPVALLPWVLVANLLFTMLTEIPTGAFADVSGRKRSYLLAVGLSGLGYLMYAAVAYAPGAPGMTLAVVIGAELLLAVGYTFYSGALEAWVVDLRGDRDPNALKPVFSRAQWVKNLLYLTGGLLGIAVFQAGVKWFSPFLLGALICLGVVLHGSRWMIPDWPARRGAEDAASARQGSRPYLRHVRRSIQRLRRRPDVAWLMISAAVAFFVLQFIVFFWPLYLVQLLAPGNRPSLLHEDALMLALSWVLAYGARGLGNALPVLPLLRDRHFAGIALSLGLSSAALMVLAGLMQFSGTLSVFALGASSSLLYALVRLGEGAGDPLRQFLLNRLLNAGDRSTMLSLGSTLSMLVSALGLALCALALHHGLTLSMLMAIAAVVQFATLGIYHVVLSSGRDYATRRA